MVSKLSVGYVDEVSFVHKLFGSCPSKKPALAQILSQTSPFEVQLYSHALMLLESRRSYCPLCTTTIRACVGNTLFSW